MDILVGCEESGTVRDVFHSYGHNAWSCDLQPTRTDGNHWQMDIKTCLCSTEKWDIIILHPDCTKLCLAGNKHYGKGKLRHQERLDAIKWTVGLWELAVSKAKVGVVLENPASVIFQYLRPLGANVQFIQPYQFGHLEQKKTG